MILAMSLFLSCLFSYSFRLCLFVSLCLVQSDFITVLLHADSIFVFLWKASHCITTKLPRSHFIKRPSTAAKAASNWVMECHESGAVVTLEIGTCVCAWRGTCIRLLTSEASDNENAATSLPLASNHPSAESQNSALIFIPRQQCNLVFLLVAFSGKFPSLVP